MIMWQEPNEQRRRHDCRTRTIPGGHRPRSPRPLRSANAAESHVQASFPTRATVTLGVEVLLESGCKKVTVPKHGDSGGGGRQPDRDHDPGGLGLEALNWYEANVLERRQVGHPFR